MKYFVILLVLVGLFTSSAFAFEPSYTNYFSNPEFKIYKVQENAYEFSIPYKISDAKLDRIVVDCDSTALIIYLDNVGTKGNLILNIPRALLDAKIGEQDEQMFFILDQQEVEPPEINTDSESRTFDIPLQTGGEILEIIAKNVGMFPEPNLCGVGGADESPYYQLLSPLKQTQSAIPFNEIQCKQNLVLIQKYDGSPACVTEPTKTKLVEREWTKNMTSECDTKVTPSDFKLKKNTWLSIAQLSQDKIKGNCTIITEDTLSRATFLKNAIDGADGCNDDLIYCGGGRVTLERVYDFGISLSDTLDYELSLNPDQAESLLKQVKLTPTDDLAYGAIKHNDTYYQIILHTTDSGTGAQTRGEFESVPANPVPLQKGTSVNFTYSVESFATFGSNARINLTTNNPARDSGLEIHAVPPILEIPERAQKNATITVYADNDAQDGIYQIRVSGRDADSGGLIRTDPLPYNPKVNVGNSSWEIFTYGNDRGSGFSGASPPPDWAWAELELNQDVFYENDTMEIRVYLVNNGTEPLVLDESNLLIQIIKATSDGYYSNLYGIDARLIDGKTFTVEPKSRELVARPFFWDQMTFNQNDEPYRIEPNERKIMVTLGHYNGTVWRDEVSFVMK